eukprot:TRINITY_DN16403_c0_g1_i1.p1 TRINITY_DN16403_c0_g1~~TRINITY_DN16403_c0_g1_i1.p1  ORF type:complete len:863 (+),score=158.30 TRINITY_DN16403_c0_g1_i1:19-2607(+)
MHDSFVKELFNSPEDPKRKAQLLRERLLSAAAADRCELVVAVLLNLGLDPAAGVQCLANCFVVAKESLREGLSCGQHLATALRGGGGTHAGAVADLAAVAIPKTTAGIHDAALTATSLWTALAHAEGGGRWEDLRPTPVRAAAVRLWSRRPDLGPPAPSPAALSCWLAQTDALESEKAILLAAVRQLWSEQQSQVSTRVEDLLSALLSSAGEPKSSPEWLAAAVAERSATASPWVCALLRQGVGEAAAACTEVLIAAPGGAGRAALLFAWSTLYTAMLATAFGAAFCSCDEAPKALVSTMDLLEVICSRLAGAGCWMELTATLLCVVLRWPGQGNLKTNMVDDDTVVARFLRFLRQVLLDIPDRYPEAPLAPVLPLILAALPRLEDQEHCAEIQPLLQDLLARSSLTRMSGSGTSCRAGLRNLGNTCYMNSFLQALSLTDGFTRQLFAQYPPLLGQEFNLQDDERINSAALPAKGTEVRRSLAIALARLRVSRRSVAPSKLAAMTPFGLRGQQQDVTELARWLLEQLGDADKDSLTGCCFGISSRSVVRCASCGYSQEKEESSADLCLPVSSHAFEEADDAPCENSVPPHENTMEQPVAQNGDGEADVQKSKTPRIDSKKGQGLGTVAECLRSYLAEEPLQGYRCDSCQSVDTSRRRSQIMKPPDHLIVSLGRFSFAADGGQQKDHAHISADKVLKVPVSSRDEGEAFADYSLYAIVVHAGSTPHSGHYYSLGCSSAVVSGANPVWYRYDDSSVSVLPGDASQDNLNSLVNGSATAYVLLYRRTDRVSPVRHPLRSLPAQFFAEAVLGELAEDDESWAGQGSSSTGSSLGGVSSQAPHFQPPDSDVGGAGSGMNAGGGGWIC